MEDLVNKAFMDSASAHCRLAYIFIIKNNTTMQMLSIVIAALFEVYVRTTQVSE